MINRLILALVMVVNITGAHLEDAFDATEVLKAEPIDSEAFIPYDEARQLIIRGNVNVVLGGDSNLNVVEYDPDLVNIKMLPGDVIEVAPKIMMRYGGDKEVPTVVIRSNDRFLSLYRMSIRDNSSLIAKDIESLTLSLEVRTTGHVMIEGIMNLNHLNVSNSGNVEIYWVNSHLLDVNIEKGDVVLAGRVNFLTLKGQKEAEVDASGLIAKRSWVSAVETAKVSIFPTEALYVYTKDNALVDVKHKPKIYAPVNQAPSAIVLNYVEMEKRLAAN
jgi:hypothetical protein